MTLRRRLVVYMALAALASSALTVAVAAVLVRHRVAAQRIAALANQADAAAAIDILSGTHVFRMVAGRPHRLAPSRAAAVVAAVPGQTSAQGTVQVDGRPLLFVVRPSMSGGRLVLIGPAAFRFAQWRPFLVSLILAGLGGALLAVLLALALARRLSRPVAALASATHRVAAGEEAVSVPAEGSDELADLGRSFNRMSAELSRSRAAQRRFLESVSHELRTPLTSIRGYAEALEEGAVAPDVGAPVIAAEAQRLEGLVADLLELARVGREDFSVADRELDLAEVADEAVERHRPAAESAGVSLSHVTSDRALALGDPERLLQVASNLIENALRLTPRDGLVEIRTAPGELSVRDTGPGLAGEDLPHAFERFYLHSRYRSERPAGSGLGLAIVRELATAMGGSVRAESAAEGGACFVVSLRVPAPIRQARSATPGAAPPSA